MLSPRGVSSVLDLQRELVRHIRAKKEQPNTVV
jgi:hypothetical protein